MRTILRAYVSFRWMDIITLKVTKATTRQKIMVIRIHKSSKRKKSMPIYDKDLAKGALFTR